MKREFKANHLKGMSVQTEFFTIFDVSKLNAPNKGKMPILRWITNTIINTNTSNYQFPVALICSSEFKFSA